MKLHLSLPTSKVLLGSVVTVGTFDGLHRGHLQLLGELRRHAREADLPSVVLTFVDMPFCYFFPDKCSRLLTMAEEKIVQFDDTGIDHLWIVPFDASIATTEYDQFVRQKLIEGMGMKVLLAGPDFALGKGRRGNLPALQELGKVAGYDVKVLSEKYFYQGEAVSSTRIRKALEHGQINAANAMLGRPFSFWGEVISGRGWGKKLNMPTINVDYHYRKVRPAPGVYAARAQLSPRGPWQDAALSIGTNSSVGGQQISVEFHVLGQVVKAPQVVQVQVIDWLRPQIHFDSTQKLAAQMQQDVQAVKKQLEGC